MGFDASGVGLLIDSCEAITFPFDCKEHGQYSETASFSPETCGSIGYVRQANCRPNLLKSTLIYVIKPVTEEVLKEGYTINMLEVNCQ
jgi:hypothetical protein